MKKYILILLQFMILHQCLSSITKKNSFTNAQSNLKNSKINNLKNNGNTFTNTEIYIQKMNTVKTNSLSNRRLNSNECSTYTSCGLCSATSNCIWSNFHCIDDNKTSKWYKKIMEKVITVNE